MHEHKTTVAQFLQVHTHQCIVQGTVISWWPVTTSYLPLALSCAVQDASGGCEHDRLDTHHGRHTQDICAETPNAVQMCMHTPTVFFLLSPGFQSASEGCTASDFLMGWAWAQSVKSPPPFSALVHTHSQVGVVSAGPFPNKGSYRLRVVLYEGFQPVEAGHHLMLGASTARREPVCEWHTYFVVLIQALCGAGDYVCARVIKC